MDIPELTALLYYRGRATVYLQDKGSIYFRCIRFGLRFWLAPSDTWWCSHDLL